MNISHFFPLDIHKKEFSLLDGKTPLVLSGVSNVTSKCYLVTALKKQRKFRNIFWITNDNKEIYEVKNNLPFWLEAPAVALDNFAPEMKDDYRLTEIIAGLAEGGEKTYLIAKKDTQIPIPSYQQVREGALRIQKGEDMRVVEFFNELIKMGYYPSADLILKMP